MNLRKTTYRKKNARTNTRRKNRTALCIMVAIVAVLGGVLTIKERDLDKNRKKQEQQKVELEEKIQILNEQKEEIKSKAAYIQTPKYIEDIAREKLGLVYKDEIIFKAEE